jgi:DNA-binding MarR family transcriptional regulator/predicted GNAT family N-acyltransferase
MEPESLTENVASVRRFNRLYTKAIGVIGGSYLDSPFSLGESRIFYELAQQETATASDLARQLDLDPGYLSRTLRRLEQGGLVVKSRSDSDGRQNVLALTETGNAAFTEINARSATEMRKLLETLTPEDRGRLVAAMGAIERILAPRPDRRPTLVLRPHAAGDLGWIVERHGVLYKRDYGWGEKFEALVASVMAAFGRHNDPAHERCWIAEKDGERVGAVMLVAASPETAQLRMLLVEPAARGLGLGETLVNQAIRFAEQSGYRKVTLWTHAVLVAARRIYARHGFRLVLSETHDEFGVEVVGETWEKDL